MLKISVNVNAVGLASLKVSFVGCWGSGMLAIWVWDVQCWPVGCGQTN